eukprot:765148-Hanusia_phi.AAC.7
MKLKDSPFKSKKISEGQQSVGVERKEKRRVQERRQQQGAGSRARSEGWGSAGKDGRSGRAKTKLAPLP